MNNEKERNPVIVKVGKRIQKYRTQQNLTQDHVAERAGISQKHLSRIEQGYHNPRFDMIIQIAEALNVSTDALAKDMTTDEIYVFLESIKTSSEKLSFKQMEYVKQSTELLSEINCVSK